MQRLTLAVKEHRTAASSLQVTECSKGTKVELRFPTRAGNLFSHNACGKQPGSYPEGSGGNPPCGKPGSKAYCEVEGAGSCTSSPQHTTSIYVAVKLGQFCICDVNVSKPEEFLVMLNTVRCSVNCVDFAILAFMKAEGYR
jgi:hypothetical protein